MKVWLNPDRVPAHFHTDRAHDWFVVVDGKAGFLSEFSWSSDGECYIVISKPETFTNGLAFVLDPDWIVRVES